MKDDIDTYGSAYRDRMKRVMERPAQFRRLNEREPSMVRASVLIAFMVAVLAGGVALFLVLDKVENFFR